MALEGEVKSRLSILGFVLALALGLCVLVWRSREPRGSASAEPAATSAAAQESERAAELARPAASAEAAMAALPVDDGSARRSAADDALPKISGHVVVAGGLPAGESMKVT